MHRNGWIIEAGKVLAYARKHLTGEPAEVVKAFARFAPIEPTKQ